MLYANCQAFATKRRGRKENMKVKKLIILDSCTSCPYYTNNIDVGLEDDLDEFCHLSSRKLKHEIGSDYDIPEWCKLANAAQTQLDGLAISAQQAQP